MRRIALGLAAAAAALAAGCGNPGGDLISIEVREPGRPPVRLVVTDDGRGKCGDGELGRLPSERLLEAREVERELKDELERDASFGSARAIRTTYVLESNDGTVRWTEGARPVPEGIPKATLLELKLRRELCGP